MSNIQKINSAAVKAQERQMLVNAPFKARLAGRPVILLDRSGSMAAMMRNGASRLENALEAVKDAAGGALILAFGSSVEEVSDVRGLFPSGSTAMHLAFSEAKRRGASRVAIVTDGEPDSPAMALEAARGLRVSIVFIGDGEPTEFLRDLADQTGGEFSNLGPEWTVKELSSAVKGLLTAGIEGR